MAQYGLLDLWKERYFLKSKCEDGKHHNSGSILFSHVWLLMAVTTGCLGVCLVVFCLEVMMLAFKCPGYKKKSCIFIH